MNKTVRRIVKFKKRGLIVLIFVIFIGAFLRFYNLADVAYFEFDDQYNSYLVYNLVKNNHLSLVGQEMSFGGMFLGPWHYLFLTPFYMLTDLHPLGGYIGEAMIGLLAIISYYWIGSKIFSPSVGILLAFLRAILISFINIDRTISPPYPSELLILWFLYFLVRLYQGSPRSLLVLSFLFGMMFTVHLVALPLIFVLLIILAVKRPIKLDWQLLVKSGLAFIVPVFPSLLFEIRHNFDHFRNLLKTLAQDGRASSDFSFKLQYELNWNLSSFYRLFDGEIVPKQIALFLGIFIFGLLLIFLWRQKGLFKAPFHRFLFLVTFLTVVIYYLIYPRHVPEYYFMVLVPLTLLYVGALLVELWKYLAGRIFTSVFLALVLVSNTICLMKTYNNPNKFNLAQKDAAVKSIVDHQKGKGEFSISYFTEYGRQYGFQYFFTYYGLEPREKITPPIYSLVMPRSQVAEGDLSFWFEDIGVIFPEKEPEQGKTFP